MSQALQENLELAEDKGQTWVQCSRCGHQYCPADQDWQKASHVRYIPVPKVGPIPMVGELLSGYRLKQVCCPSCGVLLHAEMVEAQ